MNTFMVSICGSPYLITIMHEHYTYMYYRPKDCAIHYTLHQGFHTALCIRDCAIYYTYNKICKVRLSTYLNFLHSARKKAVRLVGCLLLINNFFFTYLAQSFDVKFVTLVGEIL